MPTTRPHPRIFLHGMLTALAIAAIALAGCGGGGGGGGGGGESPGAATAPGTTPIPVTPVTTSPAPAPIPTNYPFATGELAAWNYLQAARTACGFGALVRDSRLDTASRAHANYLIAETTGGNLTVGHTEPNLNNPFFTGNTPGDRAVFAGYGPAVSEILAASTEFYRSTGPIVQTTPEARGESGMRGLLNSVDHLRAAVSGARVGGVGIQASSQQTVADGATSLTVNHRLGALLGFTEGTQLLGAGKVATYPCAGSAGIDYAFAPATEVPNPFREITDTRVNVGPPIYIRADPNAVLSINARSLRSAAGVEQAVRLPTVTLGSHEYFIVPASPLVPGARYTVRFAGTANGAAFDLSFSFTTRS